MTNEIAVYMEKEAVKTRFGELMGNHNAAAYISSALIAVASQEALQKCTPDSVYVSALRAATLHLSVDPNLGQAYLVPFKNKATLIVGYKGLYDMAIRTGKYRYINVDHLYEGETIDIDRLTGFAKLGGSRISDKITGYFGAFEMMTGYSKVIYMTVEEIEAHAAKYSRNYGYDDSLWKKEHDKMCRKTVLRILIRKWGYIDPSDASILEEVEETAQDTIEGEVVSNNGHEPEQSTEKISTDQALMDLGYDVPNPQKIKDITPLEKAHQMVRDSDKKPYDKMTDDELNDSIDSLSNLLKNTVNASRQNRILEKLDGIQLLLKERSELASVTVD